MLLGNDLLAVARAWHHRERVEYEAADQFRRLALLLRQTGAPDIVVELADSAAADELEHATRCRAIVDHLHPELGPAQPMLGARLGPVDWSPQRQALYASVAMSCITESLSAALLLEIRKRAESSLVRSTAQHILRDEIRHSRVGWAHLAAEAARGDVSWLAPYVPTMLREALHSDVAPATTTTHSLTGWGVLDRQTVSAITRATVEHVIAPGFARYGVSIPAGGLRSEAELRSLPPSMGRDESKV